MTDYAAEFGPEVMRLYNYWNSFFDGKVVFNRPFSKVHAAGHCRRVLLHALVVGLDVFGPDEDALEILAQASVFHDTRRIDEGFDTGHGARAAAYYKEYCSAHPDVRFHPETVFLIRYHDLDDEKGIEAIRRQFGADAPRVEKLYAVFKDADALDRPRLGPYGLDPLYLRTDKARAQVDFAKRLVAETIDPEAYRKVCRDVDRVMSRQRKMMLIAGVGAASDGLVRYILQTDGQYAVRVLAEGGSISPALRQALADTSGAIENIRGDADVFGSQDTAAILHDIITAGHIVRIDICGRTAAVEASLEAGKRLHPAIHWRVLAPFTSPV